MSQNNTIEETEVLNKDSSEDIIASTSSGSQTMVVDLDNTYSRCSSQSSPLGEGEEVEVVNNFPDSDMDKATIMFLTECGFSQYIMKWKGMYHIWHTLSGKK